MTNKTLLIHAATEAIIVSIITAVLMKKVSSCNERIQQLSTIVSKQQEQLQQCMRHIEMLYRAFSQQEEIEQKPQRRPNLPDPQSQYQAQMHNAQMHAYHQMQQQQHTQQQAPQPGGGPTDLLGSLMGFVPTMLQTMTSGNGASAIIATLDKEMPQEEAPKVDVISDEFENDINEALRAEDSKQVSIEDDSTHPNE